MAVYESPGAGRVLIALDAGPLVAEPSWTRFDELEDCRCPEFTWQRGRQTELDITEAGSARVAFNDRAGTLDDELVGKQIMLQLYDPMAAAWEPCFRGHIDAVRPAVNSEARGLANVVVECVDIFDYLAGVKMVVGTFGDVTPSGMAGVVFYEDGPVDERIESLFADASLASAMFVVFSGNVTLNEKLYGPDDDILAAVRDASDAEFPSGVANAYVDRFGRAVWHGRFAKFDPDGVSGDAGDAAWDFQHWEAATRDDLAAGRAHIREFGYSIGRDRIINSYVAWPREDENGVEFDQADVEGLVRTDPTSISAYGYRGQDASALNIKEHKTNGNTGADECGLFGDYYIANYAQPRKTVDRVTFKSIRTNHDRAADTWALITRIDISDMLHLWVAEAGLSDEQFFVEGISGICRRAGSEMDYVEVTPNLSPAAYYTDNVFE